MSFGRFAKDYWYPWLKQQIENLRYNCLAPTMPGLDNMSYETWVEE